MKPQLTLKKFVATLILLVIATAVFAQGSGKLIGSITNSKNGETITGVTVRIMGTARAASSDVSGKYNIPGLSVGKYTVEYAFIGYATKQITDVEIKADEITNLDVVLDNSEGQLLDQVVVTGSYKKNPLELYMHSRKIVHSYPMVFQVNKSEDHRIKIHRKLFVG